MVASAIVDKYIGESARIIREMVGYAARRVFSCGSGAEAKEHQPCIIFMARRSSSTYIMSIKMIRASNTSL